MKLLDRKTQWPQKSSLLMCRCLLSLVGLCISITFSIGQDISGYWQGVEYDSSLGAHPYPTSLTLTQNGAQLSGFYYQFDRNQPQYDVLFAIEKAQLANTEGSFEINTPVRENTPQGSFLCTGLVTFTYNPDRNSILAKTHYRQRECPVSIVELYRAKVKAKDPFCQTDKKDLFVYGYGTRWYADAQRQVLLYQGNHYQPTLDTTTTFYITQTVVGLETPAVPLVVNVDKVTIASSASINVLCATGKAQLVVEATGKFPLRYSLDESSYQASPNFELAKSGSYSLTVEDSLGCQVSQRIDVVNDCQAGLYLPTAFSPNGDGINDELILSFGFRSLRLEEFSVFNRWGSLIYSGEKSKDIQSGQSLWSGQLVDQSFTSDIYTYKLRVTTPTGKQLNLQGTLSVLK